MSVKEEFLYCPFQILALAKLNKKKIFFFAFQKFFLYNSPSFKIRQKDKNKCKVQNFYDYVFGL